jgi:hypothetical protein
VTTQTENTSPTATLDDLAKLLAENNMLLRRQNEIAEQPPVRVVTSPVAARMLGIGLNQLQKLAEDGMVARIANYRGKGGGHMYSIVELDRFINAAATPERHISAA